MTRDYTILALYSQPLLVLRHPVRGLIILRTWDTRLHRFGEVVLARQGAGVRATLLSRLFGVFGRTFVCFELGAWGDGEDGVQGSVACGLPDEQVWLAPIQDYKRDRMRLEDTVLV